MKVDAALARIKAVVGPRGWIDDAGEQEPYLTEARRLWRGATRLVVRRGCGGRSDLRRGEAGGRASRRQYRTGCRWGPARGPG
jgi:hypothetical protein